MQDFYMKHFPFDTPRSGQLEAIPNILESMLEKGIPYHVVVAPTGSGKSAIAMSIAKSVSELYKKTSYGNAVLQNEGPTHLTNHDAVCRIFEEQAHVSPPYLKKRSQVIHEETREYAQTHIVIATPRKQLQDQYEEEFSSLEGVSVFKGRSNYLCGVGEDGRSADDCAFKTESLKKIINRLRDNGLDDQADDLLRVRYGYCSKVQDLCPYQRAITESLKADVAIVNYYALDSLINHAQSRGNSFATKRASVLILDEAHLFPEYLRKRMTAKIRLERIIEDLEKNSDIHPDDADAGLDSLVRTFKDTLPRNHVFEGAVAVDPYDTYGKALLNNVNHYVTAVCNAMFAMSSASTTKPNPSEESTQDGWDYLHMQEILSSVLADVNSNYVDNRELPWQVSVELRQEADPLLNDSFVSYHEVTVSPKTPAPGFANLARHFDYIVMMSGTLSPGPFRDSLRISESDCRVHVIDPTSPLSYRPFVYIGNKDTNMKFSNKDNALPIIAKQIVLLAKFHSKSRGIIHTHSGYTAKDLQRYINDLCAKDRALSNRFIWHFGGPKERQMAHFMSNIEDNSILVSPSLAEGFDGKGKIARWQVIVKIPYLPRNSPEVMARLQEPDGEQWYTLQVVEALAQMYGRVCRGDNDFGVTYAVDGGLAWFMKQIHEPAIWSEIPEMFREAIDNCKKFNYLYVDNDNLSPIPRHDLDPEVHVRRGVRAGELMETLERMYLK